MARTNSAQRRWLNLTLGLVLAAGVLLSSPVPALAQGGGFDISKGIVGNLANEACRERGDCTWCDFVDLMVVIQKVILYLFGGLALVMLIWGGFGIVVSAGNQEKITQKRKVIISTLFGVLIVLAGYFTTAAIVTIITKPTSATQLDNAPLSKPWWKNVLQCYTPQDGDAYCASGAPLGSLCYKQNGDPAVCERAGNDVKCTGSACKNAPLGLGNSAECLAITSCGPYITGTTIAEQRAACAANPTKCKLDICPPISSPSTVCCIP